MNVEPTALAAFLSVATAVLGWLYTQTQARSKSQRSELRWRRHLALERGRYVRTLEQTLSNAGLDVPLKRDELVKAEREDYE